MKGEKKSFRYQSLEYNTESKEFSFGLISSFDEIEPEASMMKVEGEKYVLLSNYGENEYHCTGTCTCEENRRNSFVLTRSIFYLVAGLSSAIAIKRASEYFKDECVIQYHDTCRMSEIKSEVNECNDVNKPEEVWDERDLDTNFDDENNFNYFCSGYCALEPVLKERYIEEIKKWKDEQRVLDLGMNQNLMNFYKDVPLNVKTYNLWNEMCPDLEVEGSVIIPKTSPSPMEDARKSFEDGTLNPFCLRESSLHDKSLPRDFLLDQFKEYKNNYLCIPGKSTCRQIGDGDSEGKTD